MLKITLKILTGEMVLVQG